jgi:hypothetical protein
MHESDLSCKRRRRIDALLCRRSKNLTGHLERVYFLNPFTSIFSTLLGLPGD